MTGFASLGRELSEALLELTLQVRTIRGLVLVDRHGLPLASTLHSPGLEEKLGALAVVMSAQADRAHHELQLGPLRTGQLSGRDRQLLWVPVSHELSLIALIEAGASAGDATLHLLALARDLLELAYQHGVWPAGGKR